MGFVWIWGLFETQPGNCVLHLSLDVTRLHIYKFLEIITQKKFIILWHLTIVWRTLYISSACLINVKSFMQLNSIMPSNQCRSYFHSNEIKYIKCRKSQCQLRRCDGGNISMKLPYSFPWIPEHFSIELKLPSSKPKFNWKHIINFISMKILNSLNTQRINGINCLCAIRNRM